MSTCLTLEHNGTDIVTPLLLHLQLMPENENEDYSEDENDDEDEDKNDENENENEDEIENANLKEKDNEIIAVYLEQVCGSHMFDAFDQRLHVNGNRCFGLSSTRLHVNIPNFSVWDVSSKRLPNPLWVLDPLKPHSSRIAGNKTCYGELFERFDGPLEQCEIIKARMKEGRTGKIGGELMEQSKKEWVTNRLTRIGNKLHNLNNNNNNNNEGDDEKGEEFWDQEVSCQNRNGSIAVIKVNKYRHQHGYDDDEIADIIEDDDNEDEDETDSDKLFLIRLF